MPFYIEIVCIGEDNSDLVNRSILLMNQVQKEIIFKTPPERLKRELMKIQHEQDTYTRQNIIDKLKTYKNTAGKGRDYIIGVVSGVVNNPLADPPKVNLFGSSEAKDGLAFISLKEKRDGVVKQNNYYTNKSDIAYICYYLTRYSYGFLLPKLKGHQNNESCYFHNKVDDKNLIIKSLMSKTLCEDCNNKITYNEINQELDIALRSMMELVRKTVKWYYRFLTMFKISSNLYKNEENASKEWSWIVISLVSAIAISVIIAIAMIVPVEYYSYKWIVPVVIGIASFLIIFLKNPNHFYRRMSFSIGSTLSVIGLTPQLGDMAVESSILKIKISQNSSGIYDSLVLSLTFVFLICVVADIAISNLLKK